MNIFYDDQTSGVKLNVENSYSNGFDASEFGTTKPIVIIGTAFNGPKNTAVKVLNKEYARYVFGDEYNQVTQKEASLLPEIIDAWDNGNRSIFAIRINGIDTYKDFELATTSEYKLRVKGIFPSNTNKDIYMYYDDTTGAETIKIFKPASKATINERELGVVENFDDIIEEDILIASMYSLTKDSRLEDLIKIVNEYKDNNILQLSIINRKGEDVTLISSEINKLKIGDLFPGLYLIGRNKNLCTAKTQKTFCKVSDNPITGESNRPYYSFNGLLFKKLVCNTDINEPLPIYCEDVEDLKLNFAKAGVSMIYPFDFLTIPGKLDLLFQKDEIDYEESDLSKFEVYKRLGSGYCITAKLETRGKHDVRVIETPVTDPNRILPIENGLYSLLENLDADQRVLSSEFNADDEIKNKIPKKQDFKIAMPNFIPILNEKVKTNKVIINAIPKIDAKDYTKEKKYIFNLESIEQDYIDINELLDKLYTDKIITRMGCHKRDDIDYSSAVLPEYYLKDLSDIKLPYGTKIFVLDKNNKGKIYKYPDLVKPIDSLEDYPHLKDSLVLAGDKVYKGVVDKTVITFEEIKEEDLPKDKSEKVFKYYLTENDDIVTVYSIEKDKDTLKVEQLGTLESIINDNEDLNLIAIENEYLNENKITIKSSAFDYLTVEDFIEILSTDKYLSVMFNFELNKAMQHLSNSYILNVLVDYCEYDNNKKIVEIPGLKEGSLVHREGKIYKVKAPVTKEFEFNEQNFEEVKNINIYTNKDMNTANKKIGYDMNMYIPFKTSDNFARQLAQHCVKTSYLNGYTRGVIGVKKILNHSMESVAKRTEELFKKDYDLYIKREKGTNMLDKDSLPTHMGEAICIPVNQHIVKNPFTGYSYVANGAAALAGLITALPLDQSPTGQKINIPRTMFDYSSIQNNKLKKKGYIVFNRDYKTGEYKVEDGTTMALQTSLLRSIANNSLIRELDILIREIATPYIGKINNPSNQNSLKTDLKSRIGKLKGYIIDDCYFRMTVKSTEENMGEIIISYKVVPYGEIRQIQNNVKIVKKL